MKKDKELLMDLAKLSSSITDGSIELTKGLIEIYESYSKDELLDKFDEIRDWVHSEPNQMDLSSIIKSMRAKLKYILKQGVNDEALIGELGLLLFMLSEYLCVPMEYAIIKSYNVQRKAEGCDCCS